MQKRWQRGSVLADASPAHFVPPSPKREKVSIELALKMTNMPLGVETDADLPDELLLRLPNCRKQVLPARS